MERMEEITNVVIGTLYAVAMELAKGERTASSAKELEEAILVLEVAIDNDASVGKPIAELEEMRQLLFNLQKEIYMYAE